MRLPQSNGISEAFVKTLKRDHARVTILPDAETMMWLLPGWFEDYNPSTRTPDCASSHPESSAA